jgi:hypothetical protein
MNKTKKTNNKRIMNKRKTHTRKIRRRKINKYKIGGAPKLMVPFGSQPSQEVKSDELPEACKINIISSIDPDASIDEASASGSFEDTETLDFITRWANSINPSINSSISQPSMEPSQEPLKLSDLKSLTPELVFEDGSPTEGSLRALFRAKFGETLLEEDIKLLKCLTGPNLDELIEFLEYCIETPGKGTPSLDNFEAVVLVHGVVNLDSSALSLDMRTSFPNMNLRFAVPESMTLNVLYNESPLMPGRGYGYIINKTFDKTVFIFDEFGKHQTKQLVHPMLLGTSTHDDMSTQEAMGFWVRLADLKIIYKLADFNCAFTYAKYLDEGSSMQPDYANMTLDYSLRFINDLFRFIRNILIRKADISNEWSEEYPNVLVTQLSCRPYVGIEQTPSRIEKIWQALFTLGESNAGMVEGYAGYKTYRDSVFNVEQQVPSYVSLSQTTELDELRDEESKFNYLIDKIIALANRILVLKCLSMDEDAKETHRITIIRSIIQYYRKINFAFARAELNVPVGATIINKMAEDMGTDENPNEDFNEHLKERVHASSQDPPSWSIPSQQSQSQKSQGEYVEGTPVIAASSHEGYNWAQRSASQQSQPESRSQEFVAPPTPLSPALPPTPPHATRHSTRKTTREARRKATRKATREATRKATRSKGHIDRLATFVQRPATEASFGKRNAAATPQENHVQRPLTSIQQMHKRNKEIKETAVEIEVNKRKSGRQKHSTTLKRARSKPVTTVTPVKNFTIFEPGQFIGSSQSI